MQALILDHWLTLLMPVLVSAVAWGIAVWALRQPDAESAVVRHLIRGYDPARDDGTVSPDGRSVRTATTTGGG